MNEKDLKQMYMLDFLIFGFIANNSIFLILVNTVCVIYLILCLFMLDVSLFLVFRFVFWQ